MRRGIALMIVLALILATGIVMAQRTRPMTRPAPGQTQDMGAAMKGDAWGMGMGMAEKIIKQLNLTPDQVKQLQAIRNDFMDKTADTRTQMKAKMQQMTTLWMADPPDADAIKALATEMDALRAQLRDSAIDHAVAGIAVLTPDQRAQVRTWMKNNPHMMMGMGCGMACSAGMCHCGAEKTPAPTGSGPATSTQPW